MDPVLRFRTIRTAHFAIHFHQGEDDLAERLAAIAEEVWVEVGQALRTVPPARTEVVLADQSEVASGWATPIPYNVVFVSAAVPAGSEFIGRTDDWLRLVFTHEFTHIVHLDWSGGWARGARRIFGRIPLAFPNLWLPAWQIEGLATLGESRRAGSGRLYAGDFRAIERETWRSGRAVPLDRVNGGLTDWPGGLAPYASGLGFHAYLAGRFGEEKLGELARRTSRSAPFFGPLAFKTVFGESVDSIWRRYQADAAATARPPSTPANQSEHPTQLTRHGYVTLGPRFAPRCAACPDEIVYSTRDPHEFPALRVIGVDGSGGRRLAERYLGSTLGASRTTLVFDQLELHRNVGLYGDLYALDRASGRVSRLGRGQRLGDPDLSPDGSTIVCVREHRGSRALVLVPMAPRAAVDVLLEERGTEFNAPRWSPDGLRIVAERHRPGAQADIVTVDVTSRRLDVVASTPAARIVTPTWRPDGRAIVAAADFGGGAFNLFEFDLQAPRRLPRQLTFLPGGVTWPHVSPDGRTLVFVGYTSEGFDLFVQPYPSATEGLATGVSADAAAAVASPRESGPHPGDAAGTSGATDSAIAAAVAHARLYSPWPSLRPTAWTPLVETGDKNLRAGALVSGVDVLGRHAYSASATWLLDQPTDPGAPRAGSPDWQVAYVYDRWRPTLFTSASYRTGFSAGPATADGRATPGTLRSHEVEAGVLLPVRHVRALHRALVSVVRARDRVMLATGVRDRNLLATRLGGASRTARTFEYAVSPEGGVNVGATIELVRPGLGANTDATTTTADARAYLPGLARHHVVAIRAAGGRSTGDPAGRQTFLLGGPQAAADVLDFTRDAFSLLRGFPANRFAGSRVALANLEYRVPLARPQRGIGAWPVFLHTLHASAFADAGHAWSDGFRRRDLKTSIGAELSANVVAGFSFPFTVTVGAAWGHDGTRRQEMGTGYVRVGRAF